MMRVAVPLTFVMFHVFCAVICGVILVRSGLLLAGLGAMFVNCFVASLWATELRLHP